MIAVDLVEKIIEHFSLFKQYYYRMFNQLIN